MAKAKKAKFNRGRLTINEGRYRCPVVCDLLEDIFKNPGVPLSVLALKHGITPGRVYHLMKEKTGVGKVGALRHLERMLLARSLLFAGKRVSEVSRACGYATVQAFSRAYKRFWGKPPLKWQKWAEEIKDPAIVLKVPIEKLVPLTSGDSGKPFVIERLEYIPPGWRPLKVVKFRQGKVNPRHKKVNPGP